VQGVANTAAVYRRMFHEDRGLGPADLEERGREAQARIRAFRPALADEIEGIAAGARQPPELLFAINARTELLAGGQVAGSAPGECSTAAVLGADGTGVLAQNWDFHPDLAASRMLWTVEQDGARQLTTFTEAGIVGKIGVNSDGVALAINFLASERDGGLDGVPVHALCRALLGEARSVDDARALIAGTRLSASVCMTVAGPDADGGVTARAFECWPGGVAEVGPEPGRNWIAHTNHFLGAVAARDTLVDGPSRMSTCGRLEQLVAALEGGARDAEELIAALHGDAIFQADNDREPWLVRCATLATLAFELPGGRLSLS
jgi:isopenicillin-N N-acyltransferase-like protein